MSDSGQKRTALVAGATGLVGGALVTQLSTDARYSTVTALVRRPLEAPLPKVTQQTFDFSTLRHGGAVPMATDVYCCLGTTIRAAGSQEKFREVDFEFVVGLARAAKAAGAARFLLVTAMGASPKSSIFYNRVKGEVEDAVKAVGFETAVVFRPSILDGDRKEHRPGEGVGLSVARAISFAMVGPLKKYRPSAVRDVAAAMVVAAFEPPSRWRVVEADEIASLAARA